MFKKTTFILALAGLTPGAALVDTDYENLQQEMHWLDDPRLSPRYPVWNGDPWASPSKPSMTTR